MFVRPLIKRTASLALLLLAACAAGSAPISATTATTGVAPATAPATATTTQSTQPGTQPTESAAAPIPYNDFADLQYYLLKNSTQVVIEFFAGGDVKVVDLQCQLQTTTATPELHVRILANKTGPESKKFIWDNEGNAVYYFEIGTVDPAKLRVIYDDNDGPHPLSSAGTIDKPFTPEKALTPAK